MERSHTFTPSVSQNQATTTAVARFRPGTEETEEKATYLSAGGEAIEAVFSAWNKPDSVLS